MRYPVLLLLLLLTFPFPADAPPEPEAGPPRALFANELGVSAEAVGFPVAAAAELDNGQGNLLQGIDNYTVAIWKFTFHKKSGFVRVI